MLEQSAAATALQTCSLSRNLGEGRKIHKQITDTPSLNGDRFLSNLLIQMYGKCGCLDEARSLFDRMHSRNTFSWSILLTAYAQNGRCTEALQVYKQMEKQRIKPHKTTLVSAISACGISANLSEGKELHSRAIFHGLNHDLLVANSLLSMYSKCGSLGEAEAVFRSIAQKDSVSWNSMITAYTQNGKPLLALDLYREMKQSLRDSVTYVSVLQACAVLDDLQAGRSVHKDLADSEWKLNNLVVGTALLSMYGRCGSVHEAVSCFDSMPTRNVITWNSLIAAFARNGHYAEAVKVLRRMDAEGFKPNSVTFLGVIESVSKIGSFSDAKEIHERVARTATTATERISVGNSLITMYGKLGILDEARRIFESVRERKNVISWTAMITGYAQNGRNRDALELYKEMVAEDVRADSIALSSVLCACSRLGDLSTGKEVEAVMRSGGVSIDCTITTALINLYGKCNRVEEARVLFEDLVGNTDHQADLLAWNAMLAAYTQNGHQLEALSLYRRMTTRDGITFVTILAACSASNLRDEGRKVHEDLIELGYERDDAVGSALISFYGNCKCLDEAWGVFKNLEWISSSSSTTVAWNAMIGALQNNAEDRQALELLRRMDLEGIKANVATFTTTLVVCVSLGDLMTGKEIHARVCGCGFEVDQVLGTTLIVLYGRCSSLKEAEEVFSEMVVKDLFCVSAMIGAYAENGGGRKALQMFGKLDVEGMKPDQVTFINVLSACSCISQGRAIHDELLSCCYEADGVMGTALLCMYARCGNLEESRGIFRKMARKDSVSWSAMITAFAQHGSEAKLLFQGMTLEGIEPENPTFTSMLFSYCHGGVVNEAREFFVCMLGDFGLVPTAEHYCCIVNLLGRSGRVREADDLVQNMPYEPDYVPWMTLLGACNTHGNVEQGADAAQNMLQIVPGLYKPGAYVLLSSLFASETQS